MPVSAFTCAYVTFVVCWVIHLSDCEELLLFSFWCWDRNDLGLGYRLSLMLDYCSDACSVLFTMCVWRTWRKAIVTHLILALRTNTWTNTSIFMNLSVRTWWWKAKRARLTALLWWTRGWTFWICVWITWWCFSGS